MSDIVAREFRSPRSKLARGRHHLTSLDEALVGFASRLKAEKRIESIGPDAGPLYARGQQAHRNWALGPQRAFTAATVPPGPVYAHRVYIEHPELEEINAIVADVVQNLRQALDHAACACARATGRSDKQVYFPIRTGGADPIEATKEASRIKEQTRKLPASICDLMEKAEPGGGLIFELHKLGLADKHRLICECACHAAAQMRHMHAGLNWIASGLFEDEWDAARNCLTYALTGSPLELDYSFDFGVEVRLNTGGILTQKPATAALNQIADAVDGIIGEMATETEALLIASSR